MRFLSVGEENPPTARQNCTASAERESPASNFPGCSPRDRAGPARRARPPPANRSPELQLVQALQQAAGAVGHGGGAAEAPFVGFRVDLRLSHLSLLGGAAKRSPASPAAASGESGGCRRRRHRAGRPPPSDARGGRPGRTRRHRRRRRRVAKQGQARRPPGSGLRCLAGSGCGCGRELAGCWASHPDGPPGAPGPEEKSPAASEVPGGVGAGR